MANKNSLLMTVAACLAMSTSCATVQVVSAAKTSEVSLLKPQSEVIKEAKAFNKLADENNWHKSSSSLQRLRSVLTMLPGNTPKSDGLSPYIQQLEASAEVATKLQADMNLASDVLDRVSKAALRKIYANDELSDKEVSAFEATLIIARQAGETFQSAGAHFKLESNLDIISATKRYEAALIEADKMLSGLTLVSFNQRATPTPVSP